MRPNEKKSKGGLQTRNYEERKNVHHARVEKRESTTGTAGNPARTKRSTLSSKQNLLKAASTHTHTPECLREGDGGGWIGPPSPIAAGSQKASEEQAEEPRQRRPPSRPPTAGASVEPARFWPGELHYDA